MKAIVIEGYGGPDRLLVRERSDPKPGAGEILVRVRAAGVNPVDWKIRRGDLRMVLRLGFPYIPGGDVAGEVVDVGVGVTRFRPGEAIVAFADMKRGGGTLSPTKAASGRQSVARFRWNVPARRTKRAKPDIRAAKSCSRLDRAHIPADSAVPTPRCVRAAKSDQDTPISAAQSSRLIHSRRTCHVLYGRRVAAHSGHHTGVMS
jgi:NADPH:quinone reductase-like Zn-dependent oxidoreductase